MQGGPPKKAPPPPPSRNNVSEVKAANIAANKVANAVKGAANQAASKAPAFWCNNEGLSSSLRKRGNCGPTKSASCPIGCVPKGGRRSRRRR